jgi:hypothetical protein
VSEREHARARASKQVSEREGWEAPSPSLPPPHVRPPVSRSAVSLSVRPCLPACLPASLPPSLPPPIHLFVYIPGVLQTCYTWQTGDSSVREGGEGGRGGGGVRGVGGGRGGDAAYLPYMAKGCDSSVHMVLRSMGRVSMTACFFSRLFLFRSMGRVPMMMMMMMLMIACLWVECQSFQKRTPRQCVCVCGCVCVSVCVCVCVCVCAWVEYLPEESYRRRSHAKVVVAHNGRMLLVGHEPLRRGVLRNRLSKILRSQRPSIFTIYSYFVRTFEIFLQSIRQSPCTGTGLRPWDSLL